MSRLFNLYLNFIGRSQGYRGSAMSYSEFCSYHNSNYASGPLCGDRDAFAVFESATGSAGTSQADHPITSGTGTTAEHSLLSERGLLVPALDNTKLTVIFAAAESDGGPSCCVSRRRYCGCAYAVGVVISLCVWLHHAHFPRLCCGILGAAISLCGWLHHAHLSRRSLRRDRRRKGEWRRQLDGSARG